MSNWRYKIDVSAEWEQAENEQINAATLAGLVAKKLKELPCVDTDRELEDIIIELESMAISETANFDNFDNIYDSLCDWGDTTVGGGWPPTKMCWIGTF